MIAVLDTTALSAAMRAEASMMEFLNSRRPGDFALVPPVVAEIEYGIRRMESGSQRRALLEHQRDRFTQVFRLLPWIDDASRAFGDVKADLERRGSIIDDFDIAVTAIALSHGAEVITANLVHFGRVAGLECRHWTD